jgi:hypothetical protein
MTFRATTIERAYQLAESGTCRTIADVKRQLQVEGFSNIQDQLFGLSTTKALRDRCKASYAEAGEESPHSSDPGSSPPDAAA